MQRCAALQSQKSVRDFAQLDELAGQVEWIAESGAAEVAHPLVLSGMWVSDNQERSREVLRRRSAAGFITLLVPRWRAGDIASLVGAPSSIELHAGNFDGVAWEDGQQYAVSGVSSLRTVLHAGKWAVATGVGTVLLCFRPHMTAGPIVICTAAVAGRPSGVRLEEQRRLLGRILVEAEALGPARTSNQPEMQPDEPAADVATFLREEGETAAALLLVLLACKGDRTEDLARIARSHLSVEFKPGDLQRMLRRLPEASCSEMTLGLSALGWGAYLRRVDQVIAAMEMP